VRIKFSRAIVPNFFTLMNLYMGFSAIIAIHTSDYSKAASFILLAGIFDALDGFMARLTKSASEFGIELDSLCDAVSFGVAPSFMLWKVYLYQLGDFGVLIAALPALTGVLRLARFNVKNASLQDKAYFEGMPIPSGALMIISFIVFVYNPKYLSDDINNAALILISVMTSLIMVSKIKFDNLPRPSMKYIKSKPIFFSIFVIAVISIIVSKGLLIFPFMMLNVIYAVIREISWKFKKN
jgi:CDP-diacylglycerol--serine O-phosphatidyltransferase